MMYSIRHKLAFRGNNDVISLGCCNKQVFTPDAGQPYLDDMSWHSFALIYTRILQPEGLIHSYISCQESCKWITLRVPMDQKTWCWCKEISWERWLSASGSLRSNRNGLDIVCMLFLIFFLYIWYKTFISWKGQTCVNYKKLGFHEFGKLCRIKGHIVVKPLFQSFGIT